MPENSAEKNPSLQPFEDHDSESEFSFDLNTFLSEFNLDKAYGVGAFSSTTPSPMHEFSSFSYPDERSMTAPPGFSLQPKSIYIGNLDPRVTEPQLREIFSEAGPVAFAKIIQDKNVFRAGLKYGFVEFENSKSAENALMTMNRKLVYGMELRVNWAYSSIPTDMDQLEPTVFHIFVGDLTQEVSDITLAKTFSHFPSFCEARIMWDYVTGRSRGFGFVSMKSREDAERAIETMNGIVLGGRPIRCNWASYKNRESLSDFDSVASQTHPSNNTIYVGNLPLGVKVSQINTLLEKAALRLDGGKIQAIKLQAEKGFCFVKFDSHRSAAIAILALNRKMFMARELRCSWGKDRSSTGTASDSWGSSFESQSRTPSPGSAAPRRHTQSVCLTRGTGVHGDLEPEGPHAPQAQFRNFPRDSFLND